MLVVIVSVMFVSVFSILLPMVSMWGYFSMDSGAVLDLLFMVDGLSLFLVMLTLWIGVLMVLCSQGLCSEVFLGVVFLLCLFLFVCFLGSGVIMFYIFFELSLIPTLMLVLIWGYQPERLQAAKYLVLYTVSASLPLFGSLAYFVNSEGHGCMMFLEWSLSNVSSGMMSLWSFCISMAFLVKLPLFFVHLWLPKAHVEAPVSGSMVLAGVLLKLGVYGLLRMSCLFFCFKGLFFLLVFSISLWGSVIVGFMCLRQSDMKSFVAYSSVAHMGLLVAGLFVGSEWGLVGALGLSVAHGLCSSGMFALLGVTYETVLTRNLFLVKGLMSVCPSMTLWWFLLCVSNMGAPPSLNFLSEVFLIGSIFSFSFLSGFVLGSLVFMAAVYSLSLYCGAQHGALSGLTNVVWFKGSSHLLFFLHVAPLVGLVLCSSGFMVWI